MTSRSFATFRAPCVAAALTLATAWTLAPHRADAATSMSEVTRLPESCTDLVIDLPDAVDGLYRWRDTLALEHCDRIRRPVSMAAGSDRGARPTATGSRRRRK